MAKKITKKVKVLVLAGKATPAPPLGPALGQAGINIGEFVNQFNARCQKELKDFIGQTVTATIFVYDDRTFTFKVKTPPASNLIKKAAGVESGSGKNLVTKAGSITKKQLKEIAEMKMRDLNANDVDAAMKIIEGTARSSGIEVKG